MAIAYNNPYPVFANRYVSPYAAFGFPALNWTAIRWGRSRGVVRSALAIFSVTPNTGPAAGGTAVVIRGQGFRPGASVTFGGVSATSIVVLNSTTITAVTPAHAPGAVNVVVGVSGQTATLTGGFTYT